MPLKVSSLSRQRKFGWSFVLSRLYARLVSRYPTILDGACSTIRSNGENWTAAWNGALSGYHSKLWFLRPDVGVIIILEVRCQLLFPSSSASCVLSDC